MKMKKLLALLLALVMVVGMLPGAALATLEVPDYSGYPVHDISTGTLEITGGNDNYRIVGSSVFNAETMEFFDFHVVVDGGTHTIVLDNAEIEIVGVNFETYGVAGFYPLELKNNAQVTLVLVGENLLSWQDDYTMMPSDSAIRVPTGCSLTIQALRKKK